MQSKLIKFIPFIISGIIFVFGKYVLELLPERNPLDSLVPVFLQFNSILINSLHLGVASVHNNSLLLIGNSGPFALQVFWPSMFMDLIIYLGIVLVFVILMNIAGKRKITYLVLGIIGTIGMDVVRILVMSLFVLKVTTNVSSFEALHGKIEYMTFLPWVVIYLVVIYKIESRKKTQLPS